MYYFSSFIHKLGRHKRSLHTYLFLVANVRFQVLQSAITRDASSHKVLSNGNGYCGDCQMLVTMLNISFRWGDEIECVYERTQRQGVIRFTCI